MAIKKEVIQLGDIILFKTDPHDNIFWRLLGRLIQFFTVIIGQGGSYHRTYTHVTICENQDFMFEMTFPKSKRSPIPYEKEIELWRVKDITNEQIIKVIEWCKKNLGRWYNITHLITLGIKPGYGCGDYCADAFKSVGIILSIEGAKDKMVSPNEVCDSRLVYKIL